MAMDIDGWQVVRRLSMSAIAEVFLVRSKGESPLRVLKRLLPMYSDEGELAEIFHREAALGPHLAHPNLPRVLASGDHDGAPYIVLEHIRGVPIARFMNEMSKPLPPAIALSVFRDVVDALSHLYALRSKDGKPLVIAHRDVTPGNVLLADDGRAVLIDFGLVAGAVSRLETASNVVKATWRYAAPEQLDGGAVSSAFDVYALGTLLHLMLSGSRPFAGANDPDEILHAKKTELLSCDGLEEKFQRLISLCTHVDPLQRPAMPEGLVAEIQDFQFAPRSEIVELVRGPIADVEREDRRIAAEKRVPLSAEQKGEDVTDPLHTEDITDVAELRAPEQDSPPAYLGVWALVMVGLLLAVLIFRALG